ncbi:MAG: hypothetical protein K2I47_09205 [Odoribacter sp.]|nr:hypothetical protein [Odoribacter sp.]
MNKEMIMPYFPYGIRVATKDSYKDTAIVKELYADTFLIADCWNRCSEIPYNTETYKLVLHPVTFEHLRTPLRVNAQKFVMAEHLCGIVYDNIKDIIPSENSDWLVEMIVSYFSDRTPCPFSKSVMSKLCSVLYALHFDVFGYIERGLARNVCEMNYDSYEFDKILL